MKKLLASVGLAALGVSTLHAQFSPGVTSAERANPRGWSVGATLRGFYDDNPLTLPNSLARTTYGVEVSPAVSLNHTFNGNTALTLSYIYDLRYYESLSTTDSSHDFNIGVKHTFSDRYSMSASDSFIIAQEPTVLEPAITTSPLRTSGNNIHNTGNLSLTAGLVPNLDLQLAYANNLYSYQQTFGDVYNPAGVALSPSRAALLDRMEQLVTVNLNWKAMTDLTAVAGYSYGHTGYSSTEPVIFAGAVGAQTFGNPLNVYSQVRNNDSHFFFVGADKEFTSKLNASIRAGGEYLDYYRSGTTDLSPYVDANLTWTYMKESTAQAGVKHQHNATDVVGALPAAGGNPVLDSETTAAYLSVNHKITGGLTGGLLGQFQHSVFNGGTVNGNSEDFFIAGLNFGYRFTEYLSGETGYNWYKLVSDVSGRDYTRNMVYIGVRATY